MGARPTVIAKLAGGALGLGLLLAYLAGWHLLSDAAARFAPALALLGVAVLSLARWRLPRAAPSLATAARVAGVGAIILAFAAALSLGAFLPPWVATWASPPLGRFGGPLALGILAVAALLHALRPGPGGPRGLALDAAAWLGAAAAWLWAQTDRQIAFPAPPTTATVIEPRLRLLCGVGLLLVLLATLAVVARRAARTTGGAVRATIAAACWRWGGALTLLGLAVALATGSDLPPPFVLVAALWVAVGLARQRATGFAGIARAFGRGAGWLALVALATALLYAATSEDLEIVFLRNTAAYHAQSFWHGALDPAPAIAPEGGDLGGVVRDTDGNPLGGVSVVVAAGDGQPFSAVSDSDGRYRLVGVPTGNYLPLAVGPAHQQGGPAGFGGRVATVRPGRVAAGVDFRLRPRPAYDPSANDSLRLEPPTTVMVQGVEASAIQRRAFTFANRGKTLDGGLVHEPPPERGAGPFPILLIVYPGEAASWEGVSAPLAARDHVVISYFPRRLLDLDGDMDDLRLLLNLAGSGAFSPRGDPSRLALVGGSVSTAYTYLLARSAGTATGPPRLRAAVQYGGLFDLFVFRRSWEGGQVTIDPGISELEYLLIALGRPQERPELYLRLSPRYGLDRASLPPTLLVHAERDIIVPPEQSRLAGAGLATAAIPHQLLLYPDLEHYLDVSKGAPEQLDMLERTLAFLRTWAR